MQNQKVLILDFGGQYNQLIARRVRENNVYCEVHPYDMSLDAIRAYDPIGIIFTGGPQSVYAEGSPHADLGVYTLGVPFSVSATAASCFPMSSAGLSPPRRTIPPVNTARPSHTLTPPARSSRASPKRASHG